jgi:hypothetical protein
MWSKPCRKSSNQQTDHSNERNGRNLKRIRSGIECVSHASNNHERPKRNKTRNRNDPLGCHPRVWSVASSRGRFAAGNERAQKGGTAQRKRGDAEEGWGTRIEEPIGTDSDCNETQQHQSDRTTPDRSRT